MSKHKKKDQPKFAEISEIETEVEEQINQNSESSEDEELSVVGFLEIKKASKSSSDFKPYYVVISEGSLFWYKDSRVCHLFFLFGCFYCFRSPNILDSFI